MSTKNVPLNYIPSLDGLRAVSVGLVFLSHAGASKLVPGGFGVTVFFFLSGYLITTLLVQEFERYRRIAIKAFYLRRLVRLAPPLLVTLAFGATLVHLGLAQGDLNPATFLSQIFFYFNYFALFQTETGTSVEGLGILWSLAVEEHFYLIYPWIFVALFSGAGVIRNICWVLVLVILWRAVRYFLLDHSFWAIYSSTDTRIDSLLYGCLLAVMTAKGTAQTLFKDQMIYPLIGAALLTLLATFLLRDDAFRSTLRYSLQGIALMPIFYYAVHKHKVWMFQPLNWKPVRRIGQYSYTLYLVHFVIIEALIYNKILTGNLFLFVLLAAVLSLVYSAIVFEAFEKPFKPLRQRLTGH